MQTVDDAVKEFTRRLNCTTAAQKKIVRKLSPVCHATGEEQPDPWERHTRCTYLVECRYNVMIIGEMYRIMPC